MKKRTLKKLQYCFLVGVLFSLYYYNKNNYTYEANSPSEEWTYSGGEYQGQGLSFGGNSEPQQGALSGNSALSFASKDGLIGGGISIIGPSNRNALYGSSNNGHEYIAYSSGTSSSSDISLSSGVGINFIAVTPVKSKDDKKNQSQDHTTIAGRSSPFSFGSTPDVPAPQGGPGTPDDPVPLDGGAVAVVLCGIVAGIRKLFFGRDNSPIPA